MSVILTRLRPSALLLTTLCTPVTCLAAQTPSSAAPAAATTPAPPSRTPSEILQPVLDALTQTLGTLRLEKWKAPATLRDETDTNISSIRRDIDTTLPPLLATADAKPDSVSQILPAFRNIEALYDVVLRVAQVARVSAPAPQSAALDEAMANLDSARRTLGDRLQAAALAQEKQVADLQAALRAVPPPPPPAPVAPPPASTPKKRKPKPAPKPAPASSTPQGGA
jgi:hypothetical protein